MKKILFVIATVGLFTACQKKTPKEYCWACTIVDSVYSNIPALAKVSSSNGEHCSYTTDMINTLIKSSDKPDTLYHHNDTLEIDYPVTTCVVDY